MAKIVNKMRYSKGFHSTMAIHNFLMGFLSVKQKRALCGLSGCGLPLRRTGRLGAVGAGTPTVLPGVFGSPPLIPEAPPFIFVWAAADRAATSGVAAVLITVVILSVVCHTSDKE